MPLLAFFLRKKTFPFQFDFDVALRFNFLTATILSVEIPLNPLTTAFHTSPNVPRPRMF